LRKPIKYTVIAGIAASALALAGVADAAVSQHSNGPQGGCANGIYAGYCGTQVDTGTPALSLAAGQFGFTGRNIIATSHARGWSADFFWFAYQGGSNKIAEYAPGGVASNQVMAETGHGRIVLQRATGAPNQQWIATAVAGGFTWTNAATGDEIEANGNGAPVSAVSPPATPDSSQTWNFVTP
jgi:hypothetical protein